MDQVAALKDQGNAALAANDLDEAVRLYSEAIALDATNHVLYSNRSAAHAKAGRHAEALQDAERTIEARPDWPKGYSRKGSALAYLGRHDEAIATYERGLALDAGSAQLAEGLREVRAQKAAAMRDAFANPFNRPDLLERLGADARTRELLNDPAYVASLRALQANPSLLGSKLQDPNILTTLGVLIGIDPKGDEAMETEGAETQNPPRSEPWVPKRRPEPQEPSLPEPKRLAKAAKDEGNECYKRKEFEKAIEYYNKAIEHDPTDITFHNNLAAVYFEQKEYEQCIEECEKAIEVGRENRADFKLIAKSLLRIGNAYKKLKNYKSAKVFYEKSMSEHRTPEIKSLLSQIDKFIKEEERKSYVNPELAEKEKEIGNDLFKAGDYATAVKHYSEAIKRNPDDPKLYSNRAACYTKLVAFDLGLRDCERCVELDPTFIKGWVRKAHILQGMQQHGKAMAAFQKALEIDPNNAEAMNGYRACSIENASTSDPEKIKQRAMSDPEVQAILRDPAMRMILDQMQNDPRALQDHLKNPEIAAKIQKLLESGLIAIH